MSERKLEHMFTPRVIDFIAWVNFILKTKGRKSTTRSTLKFLKLHTNIMVEDLEPALALDKMYAIGCSAMSPPKKMTEYKLLSGRIIYFKGGLSL
jgi:hypothetical protein